MAQADLHELGAQEVLWGHGRTATGGVEGIEGGLHLLLEGRVYQGADGAQGVVVGYAVLQGGEEQEAALPLFVSAHRAASPLACLHRSGFKGRWRSSSGRLSESLRGARSSAAC